MYHKFLELKNLSLSFPHKTCFYHFSCSIQGENLIAIIGINGSSKTSLLQMILEEAKKQDISAGYVEQIPS